MVLSRVSGLPETGRAITQRPHVPVEPGMRQLTLSRFSFIRTVTVGPGIAPGLLTLRSQRHEGARGLPRRVADTAGGEFRPALRTRPSIERTNPFYEGARRPRVAGVTAPVSGLAVQALTPRRARDLPLRSENRPAVLRPAELLRECRHEEVS